MQIEVISASAGSGKTYRLADYLLTALQRDESPVRPEAVIATTFTIRAAGELKERARQHLIKAGQAELAQQLGAARIGTVNSIASRLVSEFAFELGLSPQLQVMDEVQSARILDRCLADAVFDEDREVLTDIDSRFDAFAWSDHVRQIVDLARVNQLGPADLARHAERSRQRALELLAAPHSSSEALCRRLHDALADFETQFDGSDDQTKVTTKAKAKLDKVLEQLRRGRRPAWADWARMLGFQPAARWRDLTENIRDAAYGHDHNPLLHDDIATAIERVFAIAGRALEAYDQTKKVWGYVDFVDQEVYALEALRLDAVRNVLRGNLDLVLVDEFQDTSPLQLALFLELAALSRRSVWVGDPKQAIFGFRGTDPALMEAAVRYALNTVEPETLEFSWRSRPELVEVTNQLFTPAFGLSGMSRERVTLAPQRKATAALGPALEIWKLEANNKTEDLDQLACHIRALLTAAANGEVSVSAGPAIADDQITSPQPSSNTVGVDLEQERVRPLEPGDIAVLCRRNAVASKLAQRLAELGIPSSLRRAGLLGTPEALLVRAGLRLWVDPDDAISRAEVGRLLDSDDPDRWLRSVFDRWSTATTLSVPGAEADGSSETESDTESTMAISRLLEIRQQLADAGPLTAFDQVIRAFDLREVCLGWGGDDERLANLDALRSLVVAYIQSCNLEERGCTLAGLLFDLDERFAAKKDWRAVVDSPGAVNISTWHSAKGLEWPVTILFELDTDFPPSALGVSVCSDATSFDAENPLADRWIRYWPNPFHPMQRKTPFHERLADSDATAEARAHLNAEALRLLYVGWTRARDRLILAARPDSVANGGILHHLIDEHGELLLNFNREKVFAIPEPPAWFERQPAPAVEISSHLDLQPGQAPLPARPRQHPPAFVQPSSHEIDIDRVRLANTTELGPAIAVTGSPDEASLGEAIHCFLAADQPTDSRGRRLELASAQLEKWRVASHLDPQALLAIADRLDRWIASRMPAARRLTEWPIRRIDQHGTEVRGSIDLLLLGPASPAEASEALIIDHKSFSRSIDDARHHGAQLMTYRSVVEDIFGIARVSTWIHAAILGTITELTTDSSPTSSSD